MQKKLLLNYIIILVLSALITGALAFYLIEVNYTQTKEDKLYTNSTLIENVLLEYDKIYNKINYFKLAEELSSKINSRVTFIGTDGYPIADSHNNSIIFYTHALYSEYKDAMNGYKNITNRYSKEMGKKFFYLTAPPIKLGEVEVIVRLGDSYDEVDDIKEQFISYMTISIFIGIFCSIFISYFSINKIVKPIKELTRASKLISEGQFDNKVVANTKDEIEELSYNFNQMASKLEKTINKLKKRNMEMDTILSSIQDGIIAIDSNNDIVLINESAHRILDIGREIEVGENAKDLFIGLGYFKQIGEEEIQSSNFYTEITDKTNNKIISFSIYPINDKNKIQFKTKIGTLIIIRDITSIRKLENMRRDFVANVSHELRTPLTSIGGFVETLKIKELDEKTKYRALDIIEVETERLKRLISELLTLSKIESTLNVKKSAKIDVEENILQIIDLLELQIKNKNIIVIVDVKNNINSILGDIDLFNRIFINLIDNGIKYGKDNGNINIKVSNYNEGVQIIVEDNGIGIPKEDLPRIFERFYRVDKSRASNKDGTGLGLSIVKHIVIYFGGTIEVESEFGKGSKFILKLP